MKFTVAVTARSHDGVELPLQPAASAARIVSVERKLLGRVLTELAELRTDIGTLRQQAATADDGRAQFQERLELVQLRGDEGMSAANVPRDGSPGWLAGSP